jgi:hypothetical protein
MKVVHVRTQLPPTRSLERYMLTKATRMKTDDEVDDDAVDFDDEDDHCGSRSRCALSRPNSADITVMIDEH